MGEVCNFETAKAECRIKTYTEKGNNHQRPHRIKSVTC